LKLTTGFVESTINQLIAKRFVKKQQMRWTPRGAHLLLQVRVHVLNDELGTAFQRWYPKLGSGQETQQAAKHPQEMDALLFQKLINRKPIRLVQIRNHP